MASAAISDAQPDHASARSADIAESARDNWEANSSFQPVMCAT